MTEAEDMFIRLLVAEVKRQEALIRRLSMAPTVLPPTPAPPPPAEPPAADSFTFKKGANAA